MQAPSYFCAQPSTNTCLAACTKMLLKYYGIPVSLRRVSTGIKTQRGEGALLENAGDFLLRYGFQPIIFTDSTIRTKKRHISQAESLRRLNRMISRKGFRRKAERYEAKYVAYALRRIIIGGGYLYPRRLYLPDLLCFLREKRPIIITVAFFRRGEQQLGYHTLLAIDMTRKYIYYLDPADTRKKPRIKKMLRRSFVRNMIWSDGNALTI